MRPSDKQGFCKILAGLAAIKPGGKLTPEAYDLWWAAMSGWTIDDFRSAAAHLARSVEFMPSPYHFEQLRKAARPVASEAWLKAIGSCRTAYTPQGYRGGTSGDPLIDRAVAAIGGYGAIAMCDQDKAHFLERRFTEIYESISDAEETRAALPDLSEQTFTISDLRREYLEHKGNGQGPKVS
ncbi:MAG: hypothetical protein KGL39_43095 [Patescibacteria group bacterium]|nr:hypothetical protein [Patescibacteria group bacterium]